MDLHTLEVKYPGHIFTMDGDRVLCDGHIVAIFNPAIPLDKVVENGITSAQLHEKIIEFHVRLIEDPHYYDYDVVQKRKHTEYHQLSDKNRE